MRRSAITMMGLASSGLAQAIVPASDRELLCHATQLVEADVIAAKSAGCVPRGGVCYPDRATLTLKITRVLAGREPHSATVSTGSVAPGDQRQVQVNAFSRIRGLPEGALLDGRSTTPISDADVERAFKARPLVFGLWMSGSDTTYAHVWLKSEEPWMIETLGREAILPCPVPLPSRGDD